MTDPDEKTSPTWWTPILDAIGGLPHFARYPLIVVVLIAALSAGQVSEEWVPLAYIISILGLLGYFVLEYADRKRAAATNSLQAATSPQVEEASPAPKPPALVPVPEQPTTPDELRLAYCHRIVGLCNRLDLSAVDIKAATHREAAELELGHVFTMLDVNHTEIDTEHPPAEREADVAYASSLREEQLAQRSDRLPAIQALMKWPKLVLLGDPGSGKSSFASFVSLCLAGEHVPNAPKRRSDLGLTNGFDCLPVRIVLREYVAEGLVQDKSIWEFVCGRLRRAAAGHADLSAFIPLLSEHLKTAGLLILDGLDEVPEANHTRRKLVKQVAGFCEQFRDCRVLVTARPYAYADPEWRLPGFEVKTLAPFNPDQIKTFIERWYEHVAAKDSSLSSVEAGRYAAQLTKATTEQPRLKELAPRPLLLTLMASLHRWQHGGALPDRRQELYEQVVKLLIDLWQKPKHKFDAAGQPVDEYDVFRELGIGQDQLRLALHKVAYTAHKEQPVLTGAADVPLSMLAATLYEQSDQQQDVFVHRVTRYVTDRAGLLIERVPGEQYAFPHRTFQEYLAACHLADDDFPFQLRDHLAEDDERWREAALLAAARVASTSATGLWRLVEVFCAETNKRKLSDQQYRLALRAAQAVVETGFHTRPRSDKEQPLFERLRERIQSLCETGRLEIAERDLAGKLLATLGDHRPGVGLRDNGLPDIRWCQIPNGTLMMGASRDEPDAKETEYGPDGKPFPVEVAAFDLAAYPVTVAQFRPFVEADGYTNSDYWTKAGWTWRTDSSISRPPLWNDERFHIDNLPVVGVSWYEAAAYCAWLTAQLHQSGELPEDQAIRLPTETEWEWAARGPEAHKFPWGNDWIENACNNQDAGLGLPCSVGLFPDGAAKWMDSDCCDLSGNVWEWCATKWRDGYDKPEDNDLEGQDVRVLRGGCYGNTQVNVRCGCRGRYYPGNRYDYGGFRFAQSSPQNSGS